MLKVLKTGEIGPSRPKSDRLFPAFRKRIVHQEHVGGFENTQEGTWPAFKGSKNSKNHIFNWSKGFELEGF